MRVPEWEEYLKQVLACVKFKYDHNAIYFELLNHMEDRYADFIAEGMEEEQAKKAVLLCMGDAATVGEALNLAHSPVVGWIWLCLKRVLLLSILLCLIPTGSLILSSVISLFDTYKSREESALVYTIDVDYREKVYDTTVIIDKVLYYEDETLEIRYATWINPFSSSIKWNTSLGRTVYVGDEEIPVNGGGWKGSGYYSRGQSFLEDVPLHATKIVCSLGSAIEITVDLMEGRVMADES